jgi:ribosomal protein S2
MFYDTEKRQADFRIKLKNEGMNQSQFFRAMITGYLANDDNINEYLDRYKEKENIQSKSRRKILKRENSNENLATQAFGINEDEIENIFDLIEEEHPDL